MSGLTLTPGIKFDYESRGYIWGPISSNPSIFGSEYRFQLSKKFINKLADKLCINNDKIKIEHILTLLP